MKLTQLFEAQDHDGGFFHSDGGDKIRWNSPKNTHTFFYTDTSNRPHLERTLRMSDHRGIIHLLLSVLKMMEWDEQNRYHVKSFISICQANGYDYPEFKTILKSVMAPDSIDEAKVFDVPIDWMVSQNLASHIKDACEKEGAKYFRLPVGDKQDRRIRSVNKLAVVDGLVYLTNDKRYICVIGNEKTQKIRISPSMKNVVLRTILRCLKNDTGVGFQQAKGIISVCRELGYNYPEFKTIEKSLGLREAVRGNLPKSRNIPRARSLAEFAKLASANPPPEQIDYDDMRWELDGPQDKPNVCYINSGGVEDIFLMRYGRVPYAIILQDPTGENSQHLVLDPRVQVLHYFKTHYSNNLPHSSVDKESALKTILSDYKRFIVTADDDPNIGLDLMGLGNLVESMIKIGYDWPELKQILKSIREHT